MTLRFTARLRPIALGMLALVAPAALAQQADTLFLSLGDAARLAASQQTSVELARYRVQASEARVRQRRAALYPQLSVGLAETGRTFNTATLGIDLPSEPGQPPLFDPNGQVAGPVFATDLRAQLTADVLDLAAWRRVRSAQAGVSAAEAETDAASENAAASAASAYVAAAQAQAQVDAREADRALAEDLVRIARAQLDAGVGIGLDVTRAEARLAAIEAQLVAARNRRDQTRLDLLRALDLSPDAPVAVRQIGATAPANLPAADTTSLFQQALRNRADLTAAERREAAIRAEIDAIEAERYPSLRVAAGNGLIGKSPAHPLDTYDFAVQVSVPIFEGGRTRSRIAEQRAMLNEAEARREDLREGVRFALRKAVLDLANTTEQVAAAGVQLQLAEQEVHQATRRFETGVAGNADVVTASLSLSEARNQLIAAQTQQEAAQVRLAAVRGTLTELP